MKKILIIEDDKYFRENAKIALSKKGYEAFTAQNGEEGISLLEELRPDLILCDIMMPVHDGYWVLKSIRQHNELSATPFVFMTAKVEQDDMKRGMELGANDYLVKPFKLASLIETVKLNLKEDFNPRGL